MTHTHTHTHIHTHTHTHTHTNTGSPEAMIVSEDDYIYNGYTYSNVETLGAAYVIIADHR
jgi:hypothetical protein